MSQRASVVLAQAKQRLEREQRLRAFSAAEAEETARNEVALAEADVLLAQARLAEARARLALAERDVGAARLKAPFTGTVAEQYLMPGIRRVGRDTPVLRLVSEQSPGFASPCRRGWPPRCISATRCGCGWPPWARN